MQNAVKSNKRTITLSCGRLTTGVSVPEWTGVFMLSGGYSTSAASYMQTIFRSQTPYKNGAIKSNCYAFDFAPDRTVTVIDEYVGIQQRNKNNQNGNGNKAVAIENQLRFCPVIVMEGGKEIPYDAAKLVKEVNRVYTEKVIKSGFKRGLTKNFADFTEEDHKLLAAIGDLIGGSKSVSTRNGKIVLANEGLTGDEGKGSKKTTHKSTKGNSVKSKKPKNEEAERRKHSQQVLEEIFVRFPLLLFGSVANPTGLTLQQLISNDVIDNDSWEEFMPKKFTKAMMLQIAHLVKIDVLISSAAEIIEETKKADTLPIEERVIKIADMLSRFHFPDKETVLTPWRVVNLHMSETIGGFDFYDEQHKHQIPEPRWVDRGKVTQEVFGPTATKILEINSKSGVYPLYLAYTLYRKRCKERLFAIETNEEKRQVWEQVLNENLFVLCKTKMAKKITERVLRGYTDTITHCEVYPDLVSILKGNAKAKKEKLIKDLQSRKFWKIDNNNKSMKFNAIVGNPPYQELGGSGGTNDAPIFQLFCSLATKLDNKYISMIIPSKWFAAGRENLLKDFRYYMLTCGHIQKLVTYPNSRELFTNVEIKGGVCYYMENKSYNGDCEYTLVQDEKTDTSNRKLNDFDILIRNPRIAKIVKKVQDKVVLDGDASLETIVSSDTPFGIPTNPKQSKKTPFAINDTKDDEYCIAVYYLDKSTRRIAYAKRDSIQKNKQDIDKPKMFIPASGGSGNDNIVLGVPECAPSGSVCSQTYLYVALSTEEEVRNLISYIKTKFCRALVSSIKITQHAQSSVYRFVPLQDFSKPWTDEMLYKKYDLTQSEIDYIEAMIKPMG